MAGLYFEEFEVGKTYDHEVARSVTNFDNIWHTCMTLNTQPLHINFDFTNREGLYKKPLFNSMYTLAIVIGQATSDLTRGTLIEVVGITDIQFPKPVFDGDTLYSHTQVVGVEADKSQSEFGVVELLHEGFNQSKELVATCKRKVKVRTQSK